MMLADQGEEKMTEKEKEKKLVDDQSVCGVNRFYMTCSRVASKKRLAQSCFALEPRSFRRKGMDFR